MAKFLGYEIVAQHNDTKHTDNRRSIRGYFMPLFCDNCGYENKNTANFCKSCGARMDDEEISKTEVATTQAPPGYNDPSYIPTQSVIIPQSPQVSARHNVPVEPSRTMTERVIPQPFPQGQAYSVPPPPYPPSESYSLPEKSNKNLLFLACTGIVVLFLLMVFFRGSLFSKNSTPEPTRVSSAKKTPVDLSASTPEDNGEKTSVPTKAPELKIPLKKSLTINLSCEEPGNEISSNYECVVRVNEVNSEKVHYTWRENYPSGKIQSGDWIMTDMSGSRNYNSWWHNGEYKYTKDTSPWISRKVYRELKDSGKTILNIDVAGRGDSNLKLYLSKKSTYSLKYNNQKKSLKTLLACSDKGDKITVLDDSENPLVLSADVSDSYNWHVTSISTSNISSTDSSSYDSYKDWIRKGKDYSDRGDYIEAIRSYDKAIDLAPGNNKTWYGKGDTLYKKGDYQGCLDCCNRALECHEGMNNIDGILNLKQKAHEALSGSPDGTSSNSYKFWIDKGNEYSAKGDYEGAISCYDRAVELAPENNRTWYGKADVLYKKGDYQSCINNCDRALKCHEGMTCTDDILILKRKARDALN